MERSLTWEEDRRQLLGRRISDLGLEIRGTRVERLVERLYDEMREHGLAFRPTVYLSDQWGCPDGTPLIGLMDGTVIPGFDRSTWNFFLGSDDVDKTIELVTANGGSVVRAAEDTPYGPLAAVTDPTGAAFNLSSLKD